MGIFFFSSSTVSSLNSAQHACRSYMWSKSFEKDLFPGRTKRQWLAQISQAFVNRGAKGTPAPASHSLHPGSSPSLVRSIQQVLMSLWHCFCHRLDDRTPDHPQLHDLNPHDSPNPVPNALCNLCPLRAVTIHLLLFLLRQQGARHRLWSS